jgi:AraC-like DNA-binding protein
VRLMLQPAQVLDVGLDSGFGDVSNFNHAFRAEFGLSPRSYRKNAGHVPTRTRLLSTRDSTVCQNCS